jgi:hypothetical protein
MPIWEQWPQFFRGAPPLLRELRWSSALAVRARLIERATNAVQADELIPQQPRQNRVSGPENLPGRLPQDMSIAIPQTYPVETHAS